MEEIKVKKSRKKKAENAFSDIKVNPKVADRSNAFELNAEPEDLSEINDLLAWQATEQAILPTDNGAGPRNEREILRVRKIDYTVELRDYIELTPSMCDVHGCSFDAASELGKAYNSEKRLGWKDLKHNQVLPSGITLGQHVKNLLDKHKQYAHGLNVSHIRDKKSRNSSWTGIDFLVKE